MRGETERPAGPSSPSEGPTGRPRGCRCTRRHPIITGTITITIIIIIIIVMISMIVIILFIVIIVITVIIIIVILVMHSAPPADSPSCALSPPKSLKRFLGQGQRWSW